MNVNLDSLVEALKKLETHHEQIKIDGNSLTVNKDFKEGFIAGLRYVREYVVPCFETVEIDEATAIEESYKEDIELIKFKHKTGLE